VSPLATSIRFLQTQPDARLVELARAGHERAFEALVRRYRRQLLAYCRQLSACEAAAEDVLQQALLQAWLALGDADVRDVRAWLYRIVHNVAVTNLRKRPAEHTELDESVGGVAVESQVEQRLAAREALAGMAALPEPQRAVMLSTTLDGLSHDQVADALGLTHGAVRGLIYRARAALRSAAAALTPSPLLNWAVRQDVGRRAGISEALAGGGSAGIGGLVLKGGVLAASAGALATAAGLAPTHVARTQHHRPVAHSSSHRNRRVVSLVAARTGRSDGARASSARPTPRHPVALHAGADRSPAGSSSVSTRATEGLSSRSPGRPRPSSSGSSGGDHHEGSPGGSGGASPSGGGSSSGGSASGGSSSGGSSGSDGGSSDGGDGGSSSGGDGGSTPNATDGSSGSHGSSGHDGGASAGSSDGQTVGGSSDGQTTGGSSDGQTTGGSDG
jgi:RNA polymerase sigma factor (sigma-70 family)